MTDFEIQRSAERPGIVWPFTQQGRPVDLTGNTAVTFQARAWDGTALVINGAGSVAGTATLGTVAYSFGTADTAQTGELRGWFVVAFPDGELQSPEFKVRIVDHAPGRGVPGARESMQRLIARVRSLIDDAPGPAQAFSDADVQTALDATREYVWGGETRPVPQVLGGGTTQWHTYYLAGHTEWEDGVELRDGAGGTATSPFTVDAANGVAHFAANTHGTVYYATGQVYDPHAAAADLLETLLSRYAKAYDVSMDGQSFSRSQVYAQLTKRIGQLRSKAQPRSARLYRSDYPGADPRHAAYR